MHSLCYRTLFSNNESKCGIGTEKKKVWLKKEKIVKVYIYNIYTCVCVHVNTAKSRHALESSTFLKIAPY